ncbi:hypothetical protein PUNSTDRAFT_144747, partial [Punctularia strigosozonata HHB-11173 SS5]|uniref:uncharacterized protein n=1 Tax=Punctularia strigosozonata (strain HHB-11173) TaxID=741275 RepID=UPI00044162C1
MVSCSRAITSFSTKMSVNQMTEGSGGSLMRISDVASSHVFERLNADTGCIYARCLQASRRQSFGCQRTLGHKLCGARPTHVAFKSPPTRFTHVKTRAGTKVRSGNSY